MPIKYKYTSISHTMDYKQRYQIYDKICDKLGIDIYKTRTKKDTKQVKTARRSKRSVRTW